MLINLKIIFSKVVDIIYLIIELLISIYFINTIFLTEINLSVLNS